MTGRTGFADALRVREFRALWLTQAQSVAGDQLARVALSVLVFDRTKSAALTALTYALTFVPALLGGLLLAGVADRHPRRTVLVGCDLVRAACFATMALPFVPLPVVGALVVVAVLVGQPFLAAETAMLPDLLTGDAYVGGSGLRMMTGQLAQLAGFALGGLAVAGLGARGTLALDAATFLLSALVLRLALERRRAPGSGHHASAPRPPLLGAVRELVDDRLLLLLAGLGWLSALHVVPEALAAPYAHDVGGGPVAVGLLMAAPPAGTAVGVLLFLRLAPDLRARLLGLLAVASGVPMLLCGFEPGLDTSLLLFFVLGLFAAYQVQAAATFVRLVPEDRRGRIVGFVGSGMIAAQGVGAVVFGAAGQHIGPARAVAAAGGTAIVVSLVIALAYARQLPQLSIRQRGDS